MERTNEAHASYEHMHIITISREYGSGGGEIAARLANELGWRLVDHEAVVQVAHELNISTTDAEEQDEHMDSLGVRLLNGLSLIQPPMSNSMQVIAVPSALMYHKALRKVIEKALTLDYIVIVGRGSQMLLKGRRDALHVRVIAPLEQRITYVMQREGLSFENARARIQYKDSGRTRYLQTQYHQNPSDPLLYDLVINTAVLSLDHAVQLIRAALNHKATRLQVPASLLGPVTGLPQYPRQSEDFRVPSDNTPADNK